jgi:hypothetical protein
MTHEELLNWLLCAGLYVQASDDDAWLARRAGLISECLQSMQNRDHADPSQRDGLMSFDSDQCGSTSEITTYDSLDPSLGQARRNVYMGVKCWAGYLVAAWLLDRHDDALWAERIASARHSAKRAAETVAGAWSDELGYIPAILDGQDRSAIIPVIEALAYPAQMGMDDAVADDGPFAPMIDALRRHFEAVLRPGLCQFEDGGWKLSGNNDNSWMSKIFLCQYVARAVLGIDMGEESTRHDAAHDHWWRVGCSTHSVVDQVIAGRVGNRGSTYPRTVSGFLWLDELGVEMPMPV